MKYIQWKSQLKKVVSYQQNGPLFLTFDLLIEALYKGNKPVQLKHETRGSSYFFIIHLITNCLLTGVVWKQPIWYFQTFL